MLDFKINQEESYAELDFQQLRAGLMIEDLEISSAEDVITERGQITGASHKAKMDYLNKAMSIEYSERIEQHCFSI